jgi:anti-anti-sigma factor
MTVNPSDFPLQFVDEAGRTVVRFPAGTALSESNAEAFAAALLARAEGKERPHLMVDLGGVAMLTSAILSRFVALNARVRELGGRLTLFNTTPTVRQVFKVTRLDTLLEVHALNDPLPV